jgi:hypothetical protein
MNYETIKTPKEEYDQLVQAVCKTAAPEMEKLVQVSISALKHMNSTDFFDDIYARNLWDEYCWQLQDGPTDINYMGLGTVGDGFDDVLKTVIVGAIDKLPQHTLLLLSIYCINNLDKENDLDSSLCIYLDEIVYAVKESVDQYALRRNVEIIGPHRGEEITMEVNLDGLAGEALSDAEETSDFLSEHVDLLLEGGDSNIEKVSHSLLERYVELINEDEDGFLLSALFKRFEKEIIAMVLEKDILPMVKAVTDQLDKDL